MSRLMQVGGFTLGIALTMLLVTYLLWIISKKIKDPFLFKDLFYCTIPAFWILVPLGLIGVYSKITWLAWVLLFWAMAVLVVGLNRNLDIPVRRAFFMVILSLAAIFIIRMTFAGMSLG